MRKLLAATGVVVTVALSVALVGVRGHAADESANEAFRQLHLFGNVFERVRSQYVDEKSDKELIEAAIKGMLSSLDPHSAYVPEETYEDLQVETRGAFGGLGIQVTMEEGLVKVISPMDDTPAARAGMQANDLISHLDGEPVMGLTLDDAVDKMRGLVGSELTITVLRGDKEPFDVKIVRDVIKIASTRSEIIDDRIGYLRISSFTGTTTDGLNKEIEKAKDELGDELIGFVLDLRNNPGGLLNEAISVVDTFLDKGEVVSTRGRLEDDVQRFNAKGGDLTDGLPLVVLVNGGSASASEIVAGALQDHKRAIILGTSTFGKGSVQSIIRLPTFGGIRMTTARYFTPAGTSIQATGITPDIIVRPAKVEELDTGAGRKESDLRGALDNPDEASATPEEGEEGDTPAPTETEAKEEEGSDNATPETSENDGATEGEGSEGAATEGEETAEGEAAEEPDPIDYQLQRATDLLKGSAFFTKRMAKN